MVGERGTSRNGGGEGGELGRRALAGLRVQYLA